MRVSSRNNTQVMLSQMHNNNMKMSQIMQQLSTQKRVNVPSDDPIAATRINQLQREQSTIAQYQDNITRLSGSLSTQEAQVQSASDLLWAMNDTLLQAANGSNGDKNMQGFGMELNMLLDSFVDTVNTKSASGSYLFGGTKNQTAPIQWDDATESWVFMGNHNTRETTVANGVQVTENVHLAQCLSLGGDELGLLNELYTLSEKMQDPAVPPASYQQDIQNLLDAVSDAQDEIGAIFTELGGRQNQLTLLQNAHTDVSTANGMVLSELADADVATSTIELQLYVNATQITFRAWNMVNQLSLFNSMG